MSDMSDEGVAWPSYVDFLSSFVFVLMLFLVSTVYIVSGAIEEYSVRERVRGVSDDLTDSGITNVVEGTRIRISLRNKVTFPVEGTTLDATDEKYLRALGALISANSDFRRVVVEGHADKLAVENDEFGNWRYSVDRALAVLRFLYLCTDCGFDQKEMRSKLVLRGEGDLDAEALTLTQLRSGRAEDRRVDIVLDFGDGSER